jgi:flagellar basal-body rod modification protein FlgD
MGTFMNLLTTELANQDPLDPTDDTSFYSQMAQMGTLQGMNNLQDAEQVQQAQSLMGATVTAVNPLTNTGTGSAATVTGTVTQLSITNGVYSLGIQQANGGIVSVPMSAIQQINATSTSSLTGMIGATVSGTAAATTNGVTSTAAASGTVIGISMTSGQPMLEVQTSTGAIVTMSPSSVTNIASPSA